MSAHGLGRLKFVLFLPVLALAWLPLAVPTRAAEPVVSDVRVLHHVDWVAASRYTATVMITNMTAEPIDSWTLEFELFPVADRIDLAAWTLDETTHIVRGTGAMRSIGPGQMVWFTYEAEWAGSAVPVPSVCRFNGSGCTIEPVVPPTPNPQIELPVDVVYWVAWSGLTQYRAQVWIHNTSEDPIDFWNLEFTPGSTITSIDHVSWSSAGSAHSVAGKGWTRRIEPDGVVWFTIEGVHTGELIDPIDCVFNGFACEFLGPEDITSEDEPDVPVGGFCTKSVDEVPSALVEDISFSFKWNTLWATGYTAGIEITNLATDRPIRNWKLVFEMASSITITRFWNGDLTKSGNRYTVSSLLYNNCLEPGVTVTVGFEGAHNGAPTKPTFCEFGGETCSFSARFGSTDTEAEGDVSPAGFVLDAPYPNPFSDSARLPFAVDRTQQVELSIWDLQGRRVSTPFSGLVAAGDRVDAIVDGRDLAPGMYLARLEGEAGASVARRILVVR